MGSRRFQSPWSSHSQIAPPIRAGYLSKRSLYSPMEPIELFIAWAYSHRYIGLVSRSSFAIPSRLAGLVYIWLSIPAGLLAPMPNAS